MTRLRTNRTPDSVSPSASPPAMTTASTRMPRQTQAEGGRRQSEGEPDDNASDRSRHQRRSRIRRLPQLGARTAWSSRLRRRSASCTGIRAPAAPIRPRRDRERCHGPLLDGRREATVFAVPVDVRCKTPTVPLGTWSSNHLPEPGVGTKAVGQVAASLTADRPGGTTSPRTGPRRRSAEWRSMATLWGR